MTEWPALLSIAVWGISLWILWLSAWDAESSRIRRAERENGGARGAELDPLLYSDLEVRFAGWLQFAAFLYAWVQSGAALFPEPRPAWSFALILLGILPALGILVWGLAVGRRRARPSYVRWALAPIRGLAMWVSWIAVVAARLRRLGRAEEQPGEGKPEIGPSEASFREGVEDLVSLTLEEIMIPRSQVVALEGNKSVREAIAVVRRSPHTIYPVYGESVDQPLGVARILDLIRPDALDRPLAEFARPARIVPETMSGLGLLSDLCDAVIPAALVVDEFGGMAGFVTVEDLVEVLVGDLVGEHEVVRDRILSLDQQSYRVDGTCTVEEFNDRFGPLLPEGEYETVAGLFLDRVGRIPQEGDEVKLPKVTLEVLQRTDRRILWLKAVLMPAGRAVAP